MLFFNMKTEKTFVSMFMHYFNLLFMFYYKETKQNGYYIQISQIWFCLIYIQVKKKTFVWFNLWGTDITTSIFSCEYDFNFNKFIVKLL